MVSELFKKCRFLEELNGNSCKTLSIACIEEGDRRTYRRHKRFYALYTWRWKILHATSEISLPLMLSLFFLRKVSWRVCMQMDIWLFVFVPFWNKFRESGCTYFLGFLCSSFLLECNRSVARIFVLSTFKKLTYLL